jgi:hypothetical protein
MKVMVQLLVCREGFEFCPLRQAVFVRVDSGDVRGHFLSKCCPILTASSQGGVMMRTLSRVRLGIDDDIIRKNISKIRGVYGDPDAKYIRNCLEMR